MSEGAENESEHEHVFKSLDLWAAKKKLYNISDINEVSKKKKAG